MITPFRRDAASQSTHPGRYEGVYNGNGPVRPPRPLRPGYYEQKSKPAPQRHREVLPVIEQLVDQVRSAHTPGSVVHASGGEVVLDVNVGDMRCILVRIPQNGAPQAQTVLSGRERQIVELVALGHPNKIIADILQISTHTVSTHIRHMFAKLGVTSRSAMVAQFNKISGYERLLKPEAATTTSALTRSDSLLLA